MTEFPRGLGAIIDNFDLVVMDLWGCMHDGVTCYPAALDALHKLRERHVPVALVSNAPRRIETVRPRMRALGISDDLYAGFYTSGEEVWTHLARKDDPAYAALGQRAYQMMGEQDHGFAEGLDLLPVGDIAAADFILALGVAGPSIRIEDFAEVLTAARARDLPLVCANPDLLVHRGGIAEICAGAIADAYAALGGRVIVEGKPHPGVYRRVLADFRIASPDRMLCVGDSLRTDVAGATGVGAKSLFIAGGIHHGDLLRGEELDQAALARISAGFTGPDFALPYLAW